MADLDAVASTTATAGADLQRLSNALEVGDHFVAKQNTTRLAYADAVGISFYPRSNAGVVQAASTPSRWDYWNLIRYLNGINYYGVQAAGYPANVAVPHSNYDDCIMPVAARWVDFAYGKGLFVAIAGGGTDTYAVSVEGTSNTWRTQLLPSVDDWGGIYFFNGMFILVNRVSSATYYTSPSGLTGTWTQRTVNDGMGISAPLHGAGTRLFSHQHETLDGITWVGTTSGERSIAYFKTDLGHEVYSRVYGSTSGGANGGVYTRVDNGNWVYHQADLPNGSYPYGAVYGYVGPGWPGLLVTAPFADLIDDVQQYGLNITMYPVVEGDISAYARATAAGALYSDFTATAAATPAVSASVSTGITLFASAAAAAGTVGDIIDTALNAAVQAASSAAAALTTQIKCAAAAVIETTRTAALLTGIVLSAVSVSVAAGSARLPAEVPLDASVVAEATLSGTLPDTSLNTVSLASSSTTGDVTTGIQLSTITVATYTPPVGDAVDLSITGGYTAPSGSNLVLAWPSDTLTTTSTATATAALYVPYINVESAVGATADATADITTGITAAASAYAVASAEASLQQPATIDAAATAEAGASANLSTQILASAATAAEASSSVGLTTQILVEATAGAIGTGAGELTTQIVISGAAASTADVTATLTSSGATLFSAAVGEVSAVGEVTTGILLSGAGSCILSVTGALDTDIILAADVGGVATTIAALTGVSAGLYAQSAAEAAAAGELSTGIRCAAGAVALSTAVTDLETQIRLSGSVIAVAASTARLAAAKPLGGLDSISVSTRATPLSVRTAASDVPVRTADSAVTDTVVLVASTDTVVYTSRSAT